MNIKKWYQKRGIGFILKRAKNLVSRYSLSPQKSIERIDSVVKALRDYDCYPTFAVPGIVLEHNSPFIRHLQAAGAEIAVHGYNHVDLKAYTPDEAGRQLQIARDIFQANGLVAHGFRCPYLSASDELIRALPLGMFKYSSNKGLQWPNGLFSDPAKSLLYETIDSFYIPQKAEAVLSMPWFQDGLVEIPVCVPDDLQLHDGLGYGLEQVAHFWLDVLHCTHQRGELFNLMFHPELASFCESPFLTVLREAQTLQPKVWLARLHEVSDWWVEKSSFRVETAYEGDQFILKPHCSPRAALLCRGFTPLAPASQWNKEYLRLEAQPFHFEGPTIPFIGLSPAIPRWVKPSLEQMGYILDTGETASRCSIYINEAFMGGVENPVDLIASIENTPAPLVRFWPWPDGARSALCITGDLDALTFFDYAYRLFKR